MDDGPLPPDWVSELLPQAELKYLRMLLTSDSRKERETNRWVGAAFTVMRVSHRSVVVKRELSGKTKLSIPVDLRSHSHPMVKNEIINRSG